MNKSPVIDQSFQWDLKKKPINPNLTSVCSALINYLMLAFWSCGLLTGPVGVGAATLCVNFDFLPHPLHWPGAGREAVSVVVWR